MRKGKGVVSKCLMITLPNTANNTAMPYSLPHFSLLRPRKYGKQYGYSHTVAVFISEKRHFYRRGIQIYIIITPETSDATQAPIATVRSDFSKTCWQTSDPALIHTK